MDITLDVMLLQETVTPKASHQQPALEGTWASCILEANATCAVFLAYREGR